MCQKLTNTIKQQYVKASNAVFVKGTAGNWFHISVGVRKDCLLSPNLFNIFLERIMTEALENHHGTDNLRFADDIDGLAGDE